MFKFAKTLGVTVGFFFEGIEGVSEDGAAVVEFRTVDLQLAKRIASIRNAKMKRAMIDLIDSLKLRSGAPLRPV